MSSMKGTNNNLLIIYIEKVQAAIRSELFSDISRKQGYLLISKSLAEIADKEREYAKWIYNMSQKLKTSQMKNLRLEVDIPTFIGTILENLENLIIQKEHNWKFLYPKFAKLAQKERFSVVAVKLREIENTEKLQYYHLKMLLEVMRKKWLIDKDELNVWSCIQCGFEIAMENLPDDWICPSCGHLKSYFKNVIYKLNGKDKLFIGKEITTWICMECGYEIELEELPDDWKCPKCKHPKQYFKIKPKIYGKDTTLIKKGGMALWICSDCGHESKINLPKDWKCPLCGYPKKI